MSNRSPEKNRKYQADWYEKNRDKKILQSSNRRKLLNEWYNEYKSNLKCSMCGIEGTNNPEILTFHHKNPKEKEDGISSMMRRRLSKEKIIEEINKCEVLCENCHRFIHYENDVRVWYKNYKQTFKCVLCGEKRFQCLEFHHINPKTKKYSVSNMPGRGFTKEDILLEISKCECLCANCHRKN